MTREIAKTMLPLVKAFAEGSTIQTRVAKADGQWSEWMDEENPVFEPNDFREFSREYRVKPQPREFWLCLACDKVFQYPPKRHQGDCSSEIIHVRES